MTKAELRKTYLRRQAELSDEKRQHLSLQIADSFFGGFDLTLVSVIHFFIPIEKFREVNTRPIFRRIWANFPQITTVVPRVNFATHAMESLIYLPDTRLSTNAWGIDEPSHNEIIESSKIDIVLVPLVCFDGNGHRVGYGKGFYDRFLRTCRRDCLKIGLSFFEPVEQIEDSHDGDVMLDYVVTSESIYKFHS